MQKLIYLLPFLMLFMSAKSLMLDLPLNPEDDLVGYNFEIKADRGDTLWKIGYEYSIGISEIKLANQHLKNQQGYYKLRVGDTVYIPQQFILPIEAYRSGIVINMAERRLYYFPQDDNVVYTYPVAMGKQSTRTPTMDVIINRKVVGPYWYPPDSIRMAHFNNTGEVLPDVILPGKGNPLGTHAIYLSKPKYLIHGNNKKMSVGKFASSGCIRMYNEDIEELHGLVSTDEPVRIVHHSTKMGTLNDNLYIESHPEVDIYESPSFLNTVFIDDILNEFNGFFDINYESLQSAMSSRDGIPTLIGNVYNDDGSWTYSTNQGIDVIGSTDNDNVYQSNEYPYQYKNDNESDVIVFHY
jgi:L,D-transpeptidase ErfK/SrfK